MLEEIKIYPINTGEAEVGLALDAFLGALKGTRTVPFLAFLILGADEPVLVDTGMYIASKGEKMGLGPHRTVQTNPEKNWNLIENINKVGVKPEEVKHIIFTHLHYEHVSPYYIRQLPNAIIHIQRRELEWAAVPIGRYMAVGGGTYFYDREDIKAIIGDFWHRINVIEGDFEVVQNVKCVLFEDSHSPGSQAVYVETSLGTVILTGDLVRDNKLNIEKQCPPGIFYDIRAMEKALAKLKKDGDIFLGTHDSEILNKPVYP